MLPRKRRLKLSSKSKSKKSDFICKNSLLVLFANRNEKTEPAKFAVIVSGKVSKKATSRNKLKRRISANLRGLLPAINEGYEAIILAKKQALKAAPGEIDKSLRRLLAKVGILKEE